MAEDLFTRYGGFATVSRIVSDFYGRVLENDMLAPHFVGVDMRRQIDHQTKFVAYLMGGPASFTDEHLERVHSHMDIDDETFDEIVEVFRETLEDHDLDESDIGAITAKLVVRRRLVVKGSSGG
jgi:hemoglobin